MGPAHRGPPAPGLRAWQPGWEDGHVYRQLMRPGQEPRGEGDPPGLKALLQSHGGGDV